MRRVKEARPVKGYWICEARTPITNALDRVLQALGGWQISRTIQDAELILLHRQEDAIVGSEALRFYHEGLGGPRKRLICIEKRPVAQPQTHDDDYCRPWLFVLHDSETALPRLIEWVTLPCGDAPAFPIAPPPDICRALVGQCLHADEATLRSVSSPWPLFFDSVTTEDLYRALLCICPDFANLIHSTKRLADRQLFSHSGPGKHQQSMLCAQREWRFRETCEDLRKALVSGTFPASNGRTGILVIDDNPDEYSKDLERIVATFLPSYQLWVCKLDRKQQELLMFVRDYSSADHELRDLWKKLACFTLSTVVGTAGTTEVDTLLSVLPKVEIILIDQFFRISGDRGELLGPAITRGVSRILRDLVADRSAATSRIPEIIALSRNDDPDVIQQALRSGARDYVLKSHLLSLPSVLSRVQRAVSEHPRNLHRNFRALYQLPSETIGLLQVITIPRIALHRSKTGADTSAICHEAQQVSDLLTILPKPDLHVHLGSCMSPEFLVVASLVGLLRHEWSRTFSSNLRKLVTHLTALQRAPEELRLIKALSPNDSARGDHEAAPKEAGWVATLAHYARCHLRHHLCGKAGERTTIFRAILHSELGIPDFLDTDTALRKVNLKASVDLALFAIRYSTEINGVWDTSDIVRAYLLTLATQYHDRTGTGPSLKFEVQRGTISGAVAPTKSAAWKAKVTITDTATNIACTSLTDSRGRYAVGHLRPGVYSVRVELEGFISATLSSVCLAACSVVRADIVMTRGDRRETTELSADGVVASKDNSSNQLDLLNLFRPLSSGEEATWGAVWDEAHEFFYANDSSCVTIGHFKHFGWRWHCSFPSRLFLEWPEYPTESDISPAGFDRRSRPIEHELATGLHSTSLVEYLQGCEFSGADHLRHPFLIHLYAQQTLMQFIRKGAFYVELKGSPDGFVNQKAGFEFSNVCRCLVEAFSQAHEAVLHVYSSASMTEPAAGGISELASNWIGGLLGRRFSHASLQAIFAVGADSMSRPASPAEAVGERLFLKRRLPCKVSLVFVGKRHKSTREMILEATAVALMRPTGERPIASAKEFAETEMARCRVVGFDLAGRESDNPPELFAEEFSRLSRLHIPFTVHAGENAPASFIEDALLLLQAKRIGHGLALSEDRGLMTRVREDRVCIELCPVCNHQTSHFVPPESSAPGRRYPLKEYLEHGIYVTINTDNPIISNTNLVREYFQASYAYDDKGLSLWDALRIMRMGYVCSFLHLPERRAMIEMVEQFLFDLFSSADCIGYLRELADLQRSRAQQGSLGSGGGRAD